MNKLITIIVGCSGAYAMVDALSTAFRASPNTNLFIRIGRGFIEIACGFAGFIVSVCLLIFLEAFVAAAYDKLCEYLRKNDHEY